MQPFTVLEEITCIVRVKSVPPLLRVGVEAMLVIRRHGILTLIGVLSFGMTVVNLICLDVVPSVEFEDVVSRKEVARAELERIRAFEIVRWIVRAMRESRGLLVG